MEASIVIVGDEILSGHVRDANAHFIATRLAEHGHPLRRVAVVPDEPDEIAATLRRDLDDPRIALIFVCGGLGPTHDDRTMEGIAEALGVGLEPCVRLATRIAEIAGRVTEAKFDGDPLGLGGLQKMAIAPVGAEALECESGVIPAITLDAAGTRLVVLPGPPKQLEAIFTETVEPRFLSGTGSPVARLEIEHTFPESALAAALVAAESAFPTVKIGSYPQGRRVLIRFAGPEDDVQAAGQAVRAAIESLAESEDGRRLLRIMREHG